MNKKPLNFASRIIDTTLRDGEQGVGIAFNINDKMRMLKALVDVGVREIEVGIPAMGKRERSDIEALCLLGFPVALQTWCRAKKEDVEMAMDLPVSGIHISFPVSEEHMSIWGMGRLEVLHLLEELLTLAKRSKKKISVGAQDA
ncbi:MAG: hypothetical protein HQL32_17115, partial [Planctomycetes bacterium]|nr:hypothetical protein [Planctomycetota bacterium]